MVEIQFECEENDNQICIVLDSDENLEEIRVASPPGKDWIVISSFDLRYALRNCGYVISKINLEGD